MQPQETTRESKPVSYEEFIELWRQNVTMKKYIEFLEERLRQREEVTRKDYQKMRKYFDVMKGKVMDIFLDQRVTMGMSHPEIAEEFQKRYPAIHSVDIPRRTRELVNEGLLWSREEDGVVKFYLKLKGEGGEEP